jgi:molybdopterin-guanine dinucleotide biosynthesis protein A
MTDTPRYTGTILAGGLSRRMFEGGAGGDKTLLALGGRPMLAHVVERFEPQVSGLVLNANGDPMRFAAFGLPVVADPLEGFAGPLAGVLAGLRWTAVHHPAATHTATVSADAPFLPAGLVRDLSASLAGAPRAIALARSADGLQPVFGLWPVALADDLEAALRSGVRKVLAWTDRHETRLVDFGPERLGGRDMDPFMNVNTRDELAAVEAWLAG